MLQHSKIKKYAFIGTSSAGKTTATYQTCGFLKEHGIRVDGILQQDRRLPFSPSLLEDHAEAQYWFISNVMTAENYLVLQKGVDCIVSDRSVVDFFAYAETQWPGNLEEMRQFIMSWASTYEALYYLPPRQYDNDGVRPSDEFRLSVDQTLVALIETLPNVRFVENWKEAAREIAVEVKQAALGDVDAYLTGSWVKGKEKPGSDFDFIILASDFDKLPSDFKASLTKAPHEKMFDCAVAHDDRGLVALYHSESYNIGIQLQHSQATLIERLKVNLT